MLDRSGEVVGRSARELQRLLRLRHDGHDHDHDDDVEAAAAATMMMPRATTQRVTDSCWLLVAAGGGSQYDAVDNTYGGASFNAMHPRVEWKWKCCWLGRSLSVLQIFIFSAATRVNAPSPLVMTERPKSNVIISKATSKFSHS